MRTENLMEIADDFKKSLIGLSLDTMRRYRRTAIDFLSYNSKELSAIDAHDINDYLSYKLNQGIGHPAYLKIRAALNHFEIFCSFISQNVTQSVADLWNNYL